MCLKKKHNFYVIHFLSLTVHHLLGADFEVLEKNILITASHFACILFYYPNIVIWNMLSFQFSLVASAL